MAAPIVWEEGAGRHSVEGFVVTSRGKRVRLFSIQVSIERGGMPYRLYSTLPGYEKGLPAPTLTGGKQLAEKILDRFAAILNGE